MVVLAVAAVPAAAAGPPDSWDPRVSKLAQFVERERGLDFEHPVPVKFLPDDQFLKALRGDEKVTARDRRQADAFAADLRSLGLVAGDVDILAAQNSVDDASVVGFYDTERERMVVRGTDLDDVETRVTVAHELTHALQDQHFDLDALDARAHTSGEVFALDALVEGDAVAVEDAYVATLSRKEQDDYYASFDQGVTPSAAAEAGDDPAGPAILEIVSSAPYVFGPLLVAAAQQQEGKSALDDVYGDPPVTEEQAVDPVAFQRREQPRHVASPGSTTASSGAGAPATSAPSASTWSWPRASTRPMRSRRSTGGAATDTWASPATARTACG